MDASPAQPRKHQRRRWTPALAGLLALACAQRADGVDLDPELRLPAPDYDPPAPTQEQPRTVTVRTRPRPELAPLGGRVGSVRVDPSLELGGSYTDNLRATDTHRQADFGWRVHPRVQARTDWSRHALEGGARATTMRYQDHPDDDYDDWQLDLGGRLDMGLASALTARLETAGLHEDRAAANEAGGREVARYRVDQARAGWRHPRGRFELSVDAGAADYRFARVDDAGLTPGALVGDDRNRTSTEGSARLRYALWPGQGAFVRAAWNRQDYDRTTPDGRNRDSAGRELALGLDLELTDLLLGQAFIGHYRQRYADDAFGATGGLSFGADLAWNPTTLTTVRLRADRSVQETVLAGTSGYLSTDVALDLDHELLRNLLLGFGISRTQRRYQDLGRNERLDQAYLGVHYPLNRNVYLRMRVVHRNQDGTDGGRSYVQNLVEQSVVLMY